MNSAQDTRCRVGCPIRRSRDQRSLASPPGFSQRAASFIASQCQGIHQMPFISPDPRSRPPGGVTHRENAPRNTAAHRGKRQPRSPRPAGGELPREPAPRQQPRRGLSHEDTSFGPAPWACGPCPARKPPQDNWPEPGARPPRSYSQIHFTLQSTPPPRARPRRHRRASPNVAVKDRGRIAQIAPDRRNRPPAAAPVGASRCSSRCTCRPAKLCFACGGGERDRTDDLLLAKQALSQLSYTPVPETGSDL